MWPISESSSLISKFQTISPPSLDTSSSFQHIKNALKSPSVTMSSTLTNSPSSSMPSVTSPASTPRSSPSSVGYASTSPSPTSSECGCDNHHFHQKPHNHHKIGGLQLIGLDQALENSMPQLYEPAPVKESSAVKRLRAMLMIRRKRAFGRWETMIEDNVQIAGEPGIEIFEPRDASAHHVPSIFEILAGTA